jgi:hypothetical protein
MTLATQSSDLSPSIEVPCVTFRDKLRKQANITGHEYLFVLLSQVMQDGGVKFS